MAILNYTTSIDPHRTVGEIQRLLAANGARGILIEYNEHGDPAAVAFQIERRGDIMRYRLPCRATAVCIALNKDYKAGKVERKHTTMQHAVRVAWRIIKDWIEAQVALVNSGMVDMGEVFMPYQLVAENETLYEAMTRKMLTVREEENDIQI